MPNRRWREVMLLVVDMVSPADALLRGMKLWLDQLVSENRSVQKYLAWVKEKAQAVDVGLHEAFVRAVYWSFGFVSNDHIPVSYSRGFARFREVERGEVLELELIRAVDAADARRVVQEIDNARSRELAYDWEMDRAERQSNSSHRRLAGIVNEHEALKSAAAWIEHLRGALSSEVGFRHDCGFVESDVDKLERYERGLIVLLECLKSERVTRGCRSRILRSILLPISN
jgi:hypothetical protein